MSTQQDNRTSSVKLGVAEVLGNNYWLLIPATILLGMFCLIIFEASTQSDELQNQSITSVQQESVQGWVDLGNGLERTCDDGVTIYRDKSSGDISSIHDSYKC